MNCELVVSFSPFTTNYYLIVLFSNSALQGCKSVLIKLVVKISCIVCVVINFYGFGLLHVHVHPDATCTIVDFTDQFLKFSFRTSNQHNVTSTPEVFICD